MKKWYFIIALLFFLSISLFCADVSIRVTDRDLEIPLEGVRILDVQTNRFVFTDAEGKARLVVEDGLTRLIIMAELIGYEDRKIIIKDFTKEIVIEMLLEGVIEGEELVFEEEAIGETDEEIGISTVIEEELIESASKIGIIEDAMTAVKILPGVTYTGAFGGSLSVRGGDPSGLNVLLDGFAVKYPYHWGGMVSIFNPNIIESIKFSPGIFSSKYGQATSGILELTTVTPNEGARIEAITSTSTMELFLQMPVGNNDEAGIFTGFRLTNYDLVLKIVNETGKAMNNDTLLDMTNVISRVPYIYDFYLKTFYRPSERFEWYINGFWGNDGVGVTVDNSGLDTSETIISDFNFDYFNTDVFVSTGIKILPIDSLFIHLVTGYEYWISDVDAEIRDHGTQFYSDAFIDDYGYLLPPGDESFTIDAISNFKESIVKHGIQGRCDFDLTFGENFLLHWGLGSSLDMTDYAAEGDFWGISWEDGSPVYKKTSYDPGITGSSILDSFLYISLEADFIPDVLSLSLGARLDHSLFIGEDDYTLNTYPVLCPRLNLTFSPDIDTDFFTQNAFSIGVGLFSNNPFTIGNFTQNMDLEDFDIAMPKTLMSVIGLETTMPFGFRFKIEGYYKYLFDRFYYNVVPDSETGVSDIIIHNDGYGHSLGFDLMLNRKISRYIDGLLSYTFVYVKNKYPETDGLDPNSSQRDIWIYPYYHRFHSLNLLLNIKPTNSMTFMTKLSFATGTPKTQYGDKEMFPAFIENEDGTTTVAEMYSRPSFYSDILRSNFSFPLDLKLSIHNYYKNTKVKWEFYVAIEDILSPLWAEILPKDNTDFSLWSGNEQVAASASFSIPIPSIGYKLSY